MHLFRQAIFVLIFGMTLSAVHAQKDKKSFSFSKGEVLDILFLTQKPDVETTLKKYFNSAIPLAKKMSYQPQKGFKIVGSPTLGNYNPQNMIIGKWSSVKSRAAALQRLETDISDFHDMRREIWSTFYITYYDLKKDVNFEVDPSKYNVVTAYWSDQPDRLSKDLKDWVRSANHSGGQLILELVEGTSPFGYLYDPDYINITAWENKSAFDRFCAEKAQMDQGSITHVNQFIIQ